MTKRHLILAAIALIVGGGAMRLEAQESTQDAIRGRILGKDSVPLADVAVVATSLTDQTSRTVRTDANGAYRILFANGAGDYVLTVSRIGYQPATLEVKRHADEAVLIANMVLKPAVQVLTPMVVQAQRQRPPRNDMMGDVGGSERMVSSAVLRPDQLGDLAAMAGALTGVQYIPSSEGLAGFSILGLTPDQNLITLNGLTFGGMDIPRDALSMARLSGTVYDVSRGGFSGGILSVTVPSGTNMRSRFARLTLDEPQLQWADPVATAAGQRFSNVQASGSASGAIVPNSAFYAVSIQGGRRANPLQTLMSADRGVLDELGIASDSVQRARAIMSQFTIPVTLGRIPDDRVSDNLSALGRFDLAPSGAHALTATVNASLARRAATGLSATAAPSHGGESDNWRGLLQLGHSSYIGSGFLNDTRGSIALSNADTRPYLALPDASIRVASELEDGSSGISVIRVGGNGSLPRTMRNTDLELQNSLSWFSFDNAHRLRLTGDVQMHTASQDESPNTLGTFSYNSLADFEANRPASFTRRLSSLRTTSDELTAAASFGDAWRPRMGVQVQYGARLETARLFPQPAYNARLDSMLGVRNDVIPSPIYFSPRVGFTWTYGQAPEIPATDAMAKSPRGTIRGGVGVFQGLPSVQQLSSLLDNTGLPSAATVVSCVGSAVPTPDWSTYADPAAIPAQCLGGGVPSFADAQPSAAMLAPDYRGPRSIRSSGGWTSTILGNRIRTSIDGTFSENLQGAGAVDLNFDGRPRGTLGSELDRPMFVDPVHVATSTGATIGSDARIASAFSRVMETRSDLRSESKQLTLAFSPVQYSSSLNWSLSYVLQSIRAESRGYGGTTAGDPRTVEWGRSSADARHQVNYSLSYTVAGPVTLGLFGRVQSGLPYTPVVDGDINGDGVSGNDRAYLPLVGAPGELSQSLQTVLGALPTRARACLESQRGAIAAPNSCDGPWTATMNGRIGILSDRAGLPHRAALSLSIANPLTAIDGLLHGSAHLHGWGQPVSVDPTLLYVKGFDRTENRYVYDVNPRFGSARSAQTWMRAPFQLTLDARLAVGPDPQLQSLEMALAPGRQSDGSKMSQQQIMGRYAGMPMMNPLDAILRQSDALGLTPTQADSLSRVNAALHAVADSIWQPVATYLATLGEKFDISEAYEHVRVAQNRHLEALMRFGPRATAILTPAQRARLPMFITLHLDPQGLETMRFGGMWMLGAMGSSM